MRSGWLIAAIAATSFHAASAERPASRRSPAVEALVEEAESVDPEFSSDVLIRAAVSAGATDPAWERELLDEAFVRAYAAQEPYRRVAAPLPPDTRQQAEALAADARLDTVSLQLRVVQLMRLIAPAHARNLFEAIVVPVEAGACSSALVPAIDDYYAALGVLARETFPRSAIGRADALRFLELYLWRARLPSELPAVAKAIQQLPRTPEEAAYFERVLRVLMRTAETDARGFSVSGLELVRRFTELETADVRLGIAGSHLSDALRHLLADQLQSARCRDSDAEGRIVAAFNLILELHQSMYDGVAPLTPAETQPRRVLGAIRIDPLWETHDARRLRDAAIDLHGPTEKPPPLKTRLTSEWLWRAERLLAEIDQWTGTREPAERDYFFEKGMLYSGLVDLVPHGPVRTRVLRSFTDFLRHSDAEQRRQLWFIIANRLIELTQSEDSPQVIPILEGSAHPALVLYAHAARVLTPGKRQTALR
jgi:hypothetical protein